MSEGTPAAEPAVQETSGPVPEKEPEILLGENEAPETLKEEEEVSDIPEDIPTEGEEEINEELPVPEETSAPELSDFDENEQADGESEVAEAVSIYSQYSYHVVSDEDEYAVIDGYAGNDTELMIRLKSMDIPSDILKRYLIKTDGLKVL